MLAYAVVALTALRLGAAPPPLLPDTDVAPPRVTTLAAIPRPIVRFPVPLAVDTPPPRPRAIEYSDAYYTRLKIHRYVSYAVYPMAVAEYFVGQKLYDNPSDGVKSTHLVLATGLATAFGLNTLTGAWNLYDSRQDPNGRARRYLHTLLMLASDAGFVATAATAPGDDDFESRFGGFERGGGNRSTHRALAIGSMAVGVASGLMMTIWR